MQLNGMKCKLAAVRMHKWCECCVTEAKCRHIAKSFLLFFLNAIVFLLPESQQIGGEMFRWCWGGLFTIIPSLFFQHQCPLYLLLYSLPLKLQIEDNQSHFFKKLSTLAEQVLIILALKVVKSRHALSFLLSKLKMIPFFIAKLLNIVFLSFAPDGAHCKTLQKPTVSKVVMLRLTTVPNYKWILCSHYLCFYRG